MLGNRHDAEDVVQGLFVHLLGRQNAQSNDPAYLYRAVTNRALNVIRNRRTREALLKRHHGRETYADTGLHDNLPRRDILLRVLNDLDKKTAELMIYRYVDDMPLEEISALVGVSRKTLGKRLQKVQAKLHALQKELHHGA